MMTSLLRTFPVVKSVFSVVGEDGGDASPLLFESCVEFAALGAHQYTVRGYA
jgi:hypothetical protein